MKKKKNCSLHWENNNKAVIRNANYRCETVNYKHPLGLKCLKAFHSKFQVTHMASFHHEYILVYQSAVAYSDIVIYENSKKKKAELRTPNYNHRGLETLIKDKALNF